MGSRGEMGTWCRIERKIFAPWQLASPGPRNLPALPSETGTTVLLVKLDGSMNNDAVWHGLSTLLARAPDPRSSIECRQFSHATR